MCVVIPPVIPSDELSEESRNLRSMSLHFQSQCARSLGMTPSFVVMSIRRVVALALGAASVAGARGIPFLLSAAMVLLVTCKGPDRPASPGDTTVVDPDSAATVRTIVASADGQRFRANIAALAAFGDRTQGTQGNRDALDWIEVELRGYGYSVERHAYTYLGQPRENIYATKVGSEPQGMYIVSAHMDGRGGGQAADDDASGCSLVLEVARAFAGADVSVTRSIRFVFWNNEETGLNGSAAYVRDRASLQGVQSPPGSGVYPEPRWLGVIQHDMILFDHGLPPGETQSTLADIDVEYQTTSTYAGPSALLAETLRSLGSQHALAYPIQIGNNMNNTDSRSFQDVAPSVSVRENQRLAEIGNGANPHWHKATDLMTTYSDADFSLGLNAVRTTLAAVAALAGTRTR
jgi:hypothetical protein